MPAKKAQAIEPPLGRAFTTRECAQYLGIGMSKMRQLILAKRIRVLRAGHILIYERWAQEFQQRGAQAPIEDPQQQAAREAALDRDVMPRPLGIADLLPKVRRFPDAKATH